MVFSAQDVGPRSSDLVAGAVQPEFVQAHWPCIG